MPKHIVLIGFFAIFLARPGFAGSDSMPNQPIELAYNIHLGSFLAGTVDLTIESDGKHYRIHSDSRSQGMLDFLIGFRRRNNVAGRIIGINAEPTRYTAEGIWAGENRSVRIDYTTVNSLSFTARPSAAEDQREPVPTELLRGTVDPFSALYQAILGHHQGQGCAGRNGVFDGRRRYDFLFENLGSRPTAGPLFSGSARVCRLRQLPIAGFAQRTWLPRLVRPEWADVWVAKVRDDLPALPVRLEADAGLGVMTAHLVAIGGRKHPPGEGPSEEKAPELALPNNDGRGHGSTR